MKSLSPVFAALLAGLLFGMGLAVSNMINPSVVVGFLDVTGDWNPALGAVMAGALLVTVPGMAWMRGRQPALAASCQWPSNTQIDKPLVIGAVMFGTGWGLSGLCPGPALASLAIAPAQVALFVAAMLAGMLAYSVYVRVQAWAKTR